MPKKYTILSILLLLIIHRAYSQCSFNTASGCSCPQSGSTNCDLLPDIIVGRPPLLVSGSSGIIEYSQSGNGVNNGRLRVSVSTPNIGYGPLEIHADTVYVCGTDTFFGTAPATCPVSGLPPKQLINQWIYHKNGGTMTYTIKKAGSMTYHPSHGHMHVDDWGIYTLRTATADPNPLNWPVVGTGSKLAFCLMDFGSCSQYSGHCVDSMGNVLQNTNFPNYGLGGGSYNCSPVVQGISAGFTDIYYQYLDGMWINIPPGTCNGNYFIVVQLDPYNYFQEMNENNNVIAVPYTLTLQAGAVPTITASGPTVLCPGGSVMLSASAGNSYLWSNGATTQSINASVAGSYVVTVSTTNCTGTSLPVSVTINSLPVTSSANSNSFCLGGGTQLNASATTAGYTNTPINFSNNTVINIPDNNVNGVTSAINVSGVNPAVLLSSSVVSVTINLSHTYDSDLIISLISPSGNQINLCNQRGGSADNFISTVFSMGASTAIAAGTAPFTGTYIPDGNFGLLTGNANGTWQLKVADVVGSDIGTINSWTLSLNTQVPNGITYSWSSLPAGFTSTLQNPAVTPLVNTNYTVTATDIVTGCTGTSNVVISVNQPPTANASSNSPVCAGNNLNLVLNGNGSTFSWSGPGGFTSTLANPIITSAGTAQSGSYIVVSTSSAGCSTSSAVNVSVVNPPVLSAILTHVQCFGASTGAIDLNVTNGSNAFYLWSNGATSQDLTGIPAGTYSITVSNSACVVNATYQVTQTAFISAPAVITKVTCNGNNNGAINVTAAGGKPPYSYLWNNGSTLEDRSNLTKGSYTLTLTDACGGVLIKTYAVNQLSPTMTLTISKTHVRCSGGSTGTANISVSGGIAPFTYLWNTVPALTTSSSTNLKSQSYTITVTDAMGCTKSTTFYIGQPAPISVVVTPVNVSTSGGNDGSIATVVSGGTGPYTYNWNTIPAKTTSSITGLVAGVYKCTIKDINLCVKKITVTITEPPAIQASKLDNFGLHEQFIQINPNPNKGVMHLWFKTDKKGPARINVLDILGNKLHHIEITVHPGINTPYLDLRSLPKGIYFIHLEGTGKTKVSKVVIQ